MISLKSLLVSLALLSLLPCFFSQLTPTPAEVPFQKSVELTQEHTQEYYAISIPNLGDHDLIISISSIHETAPKVFISKTNSQPQSATTSDYYSIMPAGKVIFISNRELQVPDLSQPPFQTLYVVLSCSMRICEADFQVEFTKEFQLSGNHLVMTYKKEIENLSSAIVRLNIPEVPDANRVLIHVDTLSTVKYVPADINLAVNQGSEIPTQNKAAMIIPRSGWYEGRTAAIYKGSDLFCTKCDYVLKLGFPPGSTELRIEVQVLAAIMPLNHQSYLDAVRPNNYNTYYHQVSERGKSKDLVLWLRAQEGSVTVYIDCGIEPEKYETYRLKYKSGKANEEIVLTSEEHAKCTGLNYTVVIASEEEAVYSIKAAAREATNLQLKKNAPVVGTILAGEPIDYEIFVPMYLTEKINIRLISAPNIDMSVLNCRFYSECPNSLSGSFKHVELGENAVQPTKFDFPSQTLPDGKVVTIDIAQNGCYPLLFEKQGMLSDEEKDWPVCAFKVTIKSREPAAVDYSLSASTEGHQLLYSGQTEKGLVNAGESLFYSLFVPQAQLESLQFQLTLLSGSAKIFVSRNSAYPVMTEEATIDHEGAIVFNKLENFSGTYYVTVNGITTSSFLLNPTAISSNSQPVDYATVLEEGIQQKGVLLMKDARSAEQFYKFKLNLQENWKGKVRISVTSLRGRIVIAANNDANIPTIGLHTWMSKSHVLEISSDDENFRRQNIYHIGLYPNYDDPASAILREITYTISYSIINTETQQTGGGDSVSNKIHMLLTTGLSQHSTIQAGTTLYYKILVHPQDTPISLFKKASLGDINIYLSTDPANQYPSPQNYKLTTANTHKNEITIQKSDLDQTCTSNIANPICTVYFSVSTTSAEPVPFTLSLQLQSTQYSDEAKAIALEDGKEREFALPPATKPALFYFYPIPQENVFIDVFAAHKDVQIYALTEILLAGENSKTEFHFPSNTNAMSSSIGNEDDLHSGAAHLAIEADPTGPPVVVTIAVYFQNSARPGSASTTNTFSIVASSLARHIYPGTAYRGSVDEDSYLYFILDVPKSDSTLFITLTNVGDGDADLYVGYGEYERPTKEDHKFASSSQQRTELLEFGLPDIFPMPEMKGQWVIGVYGKSKGSFILTASYEKEKMIQLQQGLPVEMYMPKHTKMYFKYFHDRTTAFDVRVDKQSGSLGVYVSAIDSDSQQDGSSSRPTKGNSTWELTQEKQSSLKIGPDDKNFCSNCLYIIAIEVHKASKFSLLITEVGGITLLQSSLRYSDRLLPGEKKKYMLILKNSDELDLSASISAGKLDIYVLNNLVVNNTLNVWEMHLNPQNTYEILTMKKQEFIEKQHMRSFWNGEQNVISQENVFYFDFENNGAVTTEYSFSMQPPDTTIVLSANAFHDFLFKEQEERSFLFYSPHITGNLDIVLKYCITHDNTNETLDEKISEFAEGFNFEINYWSEKTTVGVGSEISPLKDEVIIENMQDAVHEETEANAGKLKSICIKQMLQIEDQEQEGRYEFIFINPYNQQIEVSIRIDSTELSFKALDRNYHGLEHFELEEKRSYQVTFSGNGYSYLNFFACSGVVKIEIGDSLEALQSGNIRPIVLSQFGERREIFMKSSVDVTSTKYFTITTHEVAKQFHDMTADVLISTNYFTEDTGEYKTNHQRDDLGVLHDPELTHKFNFDYDDSSITVNFKSIVVSDATAEHNLMYHIRLCPKGIIQNQENHCVPFVNPDECYMSHVAASASENKVITHTIEGITPGDYDLHVSASLSYGESFVRSFAYRGNSLSLGEPILNKLWDLILFFVTVGLISLCLCFGFQKLKASQRKQGRDMKVFRRARDYGFVGDDEDDDDDKSEGDTLRKRESS